MALSVPPMGSILFQLEPKAIIPIRAIISLFINGAFGEQTSEAVGVKIAILRKGRRDLKFI